MTDAMTERENTLRAIEFNHPQWIPCQIGLSPHVWKVHGIEAEKIALAHPRLFPDYREGQYESLKMPPAYRRGEHYRDNWGCLWHNLEDGLEGQVVEHPLADWAALADYRPPDPERQTERGERDWAALRKHVDATRHRGRLIVGNAERLFDRLYFLRGFENLMLDIATDDPRLARLIDMLTDYELRLIAKWLEVGVDMIGFHTDIGTQNALMVSPAKFRQHIKPMFATLFQTCRGAGVHVSLSSDGRLVEIVDDLVECGVSVHDPQLRANTLEGIVRAYKGKLCAKVDLDRQSFPFLAPRQLRDQVREVVDAMAEPEGGLMMLASVTAGDVPLANIEALCEALEETCFN